MSKSSSLKYIKIGKKNLTNIDFNNNEDKLNSPKSKKALLLLGIEEKDLYFISKNEFIQNHPELINLTEELKLRRYENYENLRKNKIKKAIELREQLLKGNLTNSLELNSNYSTKHNFRKTHSLVDLNSQRIKDKFDLIKKQNLLEIKNLIDSIFKNKEKSDENEYRLRFQIEKEAKLNQLKKEAKDKKEKEERKREKDFQEKEKLERKEQAKQYNELIRRQIEQFKKEEEKKNQLQKDYFKKQLNWQKQEAQFKKKMNDKYKQKQEIAEMKQKSLEKKNEERIRRVLEKRRKTNEKLKLQSFQREEKLKKAYIKFEKERQERKDKFNEKQKLMEQYQEEQKIKKEHELLDIQFKREEKEKRNQSIKKLNDEILAEKRMNILYHFEKNNEHVQNQRDFNEKIHQKKIYDNIIKEDNLNDLLKENQNKIKYKNLLKLKEFEDKNKKIDELKRQKEDYANQKLKLMENMREKKVKMLQEVKKLINKNNYRNKSDIYKKIFSPEELTFINLKKNASPLHNSVSQTNFYKMKKYNLDNSNRNSFFEKSNMKSDRIISQKHNFNEEEE